MENQKPAFWIVAITTSFLILPQRAHAQECDAFAKYGIYDTRHETSIVDKAESFRSWFCQSKFDSNDAANSAGLSLGYGGFSIGFDSSKESWSTFSENYCQDESYRARYQTATNLFVQTIDTTASNNMLACFLRGGLHVRIIPGARRDTFFVEAKYTSEGKVKKAEVTLFDYPKGVTCVGTLREKAVIDGAGAIAICRRSGNEAKLSISLLRPLNWNIGIHRAPSKKYPSRPPPGKSALRSPLSLVCCLECTRFVSAQEVDAHRAQVNPWSWWMAGTCSVSTNAELEAG